jgi:hypothetical protein
VSGIRDTTSCVACDNPATPKCARHTSDNHPESVHTNPKSIRR